MSELLLLCACMCMPGVIAWGTPILISEVGLVLAMWGFVGRGLWWRLHNKDKYKATLVDSGVSRVWMRVGGSGGRSS